MRFPRRSGHADADSNRRAPRAWIRAVRHLPVWLRWTALLVLVLSLLAATSLWIRTNTGSSPTGGHDAADSADAAQAVRAPGTVVSLTFDDGRASQYVYA
jgi:hypothetical protein